MPSPGDYEQLLHRLDRPRWWPARTLYSRSNAGELTGVEAVVDKDIPAIDTAALSAMTFPAGSIGPKVEACIRFARASGQPAAIGALTDAAGILAGRAGTTISA
jgi:carbamate kinase